MVIADADKCRRRARRVLLERSGLQVFEAATAAVVLRRLAEWKPILVLLSGTLPDMVMPEVCRHLKSHLAAPLVLSIAAAEAESWAGADIYLREPLGAEELMATISTCVRLCQVEATRQHGGLEVRRDRLVRHAAAGTSGAAALAGIVEPAGLQVVDAAHFADRRREGKKIRAQAQLLNTLEQAIIVTDLDWEIIYCNRFAERLYGWRADEVVGRDVIQFVAPQYTDSQRRELMDLLMAGESIRGEFTVRHRDGRTFPILAMGSPVYDDGGRLAYVICSSMDITAHKETEEALRALNASLSLADRRKDEFLAMLAHELRNPLAPMRNAARLLREPGQPDTRLDWARDMIDRQVGHLARLVDDLLDVSRLVRGRLMVKKESVDPTEVVERALEVSRPLIQGRRHELVVCLPDEPLRVLADPIRLTQVLENLLTNAAKYTPEGGRIRLEVGRDNDKVLIRVRDTGAGIPADLLPHVFDLFTQGGRGQDQGQGGLGIGLTIVKKLVELHGGEIEARSEGQGSEFTVWLPLTVAPPREIQPEPPAEEPRAPGTARRILVVDDNEDAAESLALLLGLEGHQVKAVLDGPTALKLVPEFQPNVILLDIGLPGMDGYEVARRLRERPETRAVKLVAITGYGQQDDRRRTKAAGFDHHLVKPVDPDDLNRLLATIVE